MIEIYLLGQFEIRFNGQAVELPSRSSQALLAYLTLHPETSHRRERLAGILWPETSERSARSNLRHALWRLRKLIGEQNFDADKLTIQFEPTDGTSIDVLMLQQEAFTLAEQIDCVSAYGGDLLPGFYEDWVSLERERLRAVFERKMQDLLTDLAHAGQWDEILEWGEKWTALGGAPEPAYRALMVAHKELGDQVRLAQTYARCVETLKQEFGVEPSEETQALFEQLSSGETPAEYRSEPAPDYDAVLAHHPDDAEAAHTLAQRLLQAGVRTHLEDRGLALDSPQLDELETLLSHAAGCTILVGPGGRGPWQHEGFCAVLESLVERTHGRFRIVPTRLPGGMRPRRSGLPALMLSSAWVEFTNGLDDPAVIERLAGRIRGSEASAALPADADEPVVPYRGLESFDVEHAPIFFGREALVQWSLQRLEPAGGAEGRFLAIVGPSGSGKSSLARAGIAASLLRGEIDGSEGWPLMVLRPGADPLENLAVALVGLEGEAQDPARLRSLISSLQEDPRSLHLATRLATREAGEGGRVVLLVDQFEEVFSRCADEALRSAFIDNLVHAATVEGGRTIVLLTLRADFYGKCAAYPLLASALSEHQVLVGPMTTIELRRAIEGPAARARLELSPGLVDAFLSDVEDEPGGLPLLQYALLELWKRRRGRILTFAAYREIGGVTGGLAHMAETTYEVLDLRQRQISKGILLALTQPGEGTEDTRRQVARRELLPAGESGAAVEAVVQRLADARLLTIGRKSEGSSAVIDLAHEALMSSWPRLRRWIEANRESLLIQRRLEADAQEWEKLGRDSGALYRGARLAQALEWTPEHKDQLGALASEFLQQSRLAVTRMRQLMVASASIAATLIVGFAIASLVFGINARNNEAIARSRELAATTELALQRRDLFEAYRLAIESGGAADTRESRRVLYAVLTKPLPQASLLGHTDPVYAANFSPDGSRMVTASWDDTARLWDSVSGDELMVLRGHEGGVYSATISPDGSRVATTSVDSTARLWDAASGDELTVLRGHDGPVWSAGFSPDGSRVVTAGSDGTARLWDAGSGAELVVLEGHMGIVRRVSFSPDGRQVATASEDGSARLWDAVSGAELVVLDGHEGAVTSAAFSPGGARVVTASEDGTARLWDVTTGAELAALKGHDGAVISASFSPDGRLVVTASADATARLWDAVSGAELIVFEGHKNRVFSASFSPDGSRVATASADRTVLLWDAASNREIVVLAGHKERVFSAAFSPDGSRVVTASQDRTARVWDAASATELVVLTGHMDWVFSASFSPDGSQVVTGSQDGTARLWDALSGEELAVLAGHTELVRSASFSPDGSQVVTGSQDGTARLWDALSGEELVVLKGHTALVRSASFSLDGARVLTASEDGTVRVWDAASGEELMVVLEAQTGFAWFASFSPDGTLVVTAGGDGTARLWDAGSGVELLVLDGHDGPVTSAGFSPDGTRVVTAGLDGTARVWDAATGEELLAIEGHTDRVFSSFFSPDGTRVVTASADGTARLWPIYSGDLLGIAEARFEQLFGSTEAP